MFFWSTSNFLLTIDKNAAKEFSKMNIYLSRSPKAICKKNRKYLAPGEYVYTPSPPSKKFPSSTSLEKYS